MMRHWLKFEILDLQALLDSIDKRALLEKRLRDCIKELRSDMGDLAAFEKGNFTLSSMFMTKEKMVLRAQKLKESIPNQEIDIMNQRVYLVLVTMQIVSAAIPFFKRGKFIQY